MKLPVLETKFSIFVTWAAFWVMVGYTFIFSILSLFTLDVANWYASLFGFVPAFICAVAAWLLKKWINQSPYVLRLRLPR
ncbi:MAG: hypothetical protein HYT37_01425 [Candidatus Sungbacteria bacterium]|nr:hypothetical protein [Candidatus Sungbacteria bacterium]